MEDRKQQVRCGRGWRTGRDNSAVTEAVVLPGRADKPCQFPGAADDVLDAKYSFAGQGSRLPRSPVRPDTGVTAPGWRYRAP